MYENWNLHLIAHKQFLASKGDEIMYGGLEQTSYGAGASLQNAVRPVTLRQQLEANIKTHEEEVERNKQLLKLLDENPAIEKFMDLSRGAI